MYKFAKAKEFLNYKILFNENMLGEVYLHLITILLEQRATTAHLDFFITLTEHFSTF